jgi:D-beta-D-heptose 7-phosphate kinase/D-beta-D-heptose 1-phosphate adenosyltransferase
MVKILVVGELCEDIYVYGEVNRLSPEAPIAVINPTKTVSNDGMAGNVVKNLKFLSPKSEILHIYQNEKITKTRYVHEKSNQMLLRVDDGEINGIQKLLINDNVSHLIESSDIVIISDYNKGFLDEETIRVISQKSKMCLLDTKKKISQETLKNIHFIKLNELEYKNNKEVVDNNKNKFVITLGSNGAKYLDVIYPSSNPQETIDVSGAGDSFMASFGLMFLKTKDIEKSINFANDVCANVVNKKGVSLPDTNFISLLSF